MNFLFSNSSSFDSDVEKATSPKLTSEDWSLILEICDKVGKDPQNAKECLKAITRRLFASDPHIVVHAITLLDACSSNCGKVFHLEVASRNFEQAFKKLFLTSRPNSKIHEKIKALLKKWAEGDYKTDPQLNLIPSLYESLKAEGYDFSVTEVPRKLAPIVTDPNVVTSTQEEEEIAKAIELSLKESSVQPQTLLNTVSGKKSSSLYPSVNSNMSPATNMERRQVLALYDFEAAEDNELSFKAGEIIDILDDSDPNWWKGSNSKGEGLFPSNFVTADLSVEPEQFTKIENSKKSVQFADEVETKAVKLEPETIEVEIDEQKMDRLLQYLHEADPSYEAQDAPEIFDLQDQVFAMYPLVDSALEKIDKQIAELTQLSGDAVDAVNLYHDLMRSSESSPYSTVPKLPQQQSYPYSQLRSQGPIAGISQVASQMPFRPQSSNQVPSQGVSQNLQNQQPIQNSSIYQMYNGVMNAAHPSLISGSQTIPRFSTNIANNEYATANNLTSMTLPHSFPLPPGVVHQTQGQEAQLNQNSISYPSQGFPVPINSISTPFIRPSSPGSQINQQAQYPSSNQRLI